MVKQIKNRLAQKTVRSVVKNKKNYMESVIFSTSSSFGAEAVKINTNLVVNPISNAREQIDHVMRDLKSEGHTILGFAYRTKGKGWKLDLVTGSPENDENLIQRIKTKATYLGYNGLKAFSDLGPRIKYDSFEHWITETYMKEPEMIQNYQEFFNFILADNPSIENNPDFREFVTNLFVENCKNSLLNGLVGNLLNILFTRKDLR